MNRDKAALVFTVILAISLLSLHDQGLIFRNFLSSGVSGDGIVGCIRTSIFNVSGPNVWISPCVLRERKPVCTSLTGIPCCSASSITASKAIAAFRTLSGAFLSSNTDMPSPREGHDSSKISISPLPLGGSARVLSFRHWALYRSPANAAAGNHSSWSPCSKFCSPQMVITTLCPLNGLRCFLKFSRFLNMRISRVPSQTSLSCKALAFFSSSNSALFAFSAASAASRAEFAAEPALSIARVV